MSRGMIKMDPSILSLKSVADWKPNGDVFEEKWDDRRADDLVKSLPYGTKVMVQDETGYGYVAGHQPGYLPEHEAEVIVRYPPTLKGELEQLYDYPVKDITIVKPKGRKSRSRSPSKSRL